MPSLAIALSRFPYICSSSSGAVLEWGHGYLYNAVLSSAVLRVGARGVRWCQTCVLAEAPRVADSVANDGRAGVIPCHAVRGALCTATFLNESVRLFPVAQATVSAQALHWQDPALAALAGAGAAGCAGEASSRALVFNNGSGYDVSLCDLVHGGLEVAFYPQTGMLSWRRRDTSGFFASTLWRALATITVLYLFARVCSNISAIARRAPRASDWHLVLAMVLALFSSFWATAQNDFNREEEILSVVLQAYACTCCALLLWQWTWNKYKARYKTVHEYSPLQIAEKTAASVVQVSAHAGINTTGPLIAVLLLLTAHLHDTYETPFMSIFVLMFTARSFLKFLNVALRHSSAASHGLQGLPGLWKLAGLVADTAVLVCVLELGARSGARSAAEYSNTAAGLLLVGTLAGVFLYRVVEAGA
jgi:hypothetical protein